MDFTRDPIIETIITPREGFKLVIRSSKGVAQEEFFVDAVEVVSFGNALFFRSLERPKSFIVPVTDYEVLEVREARMVLKNVGADKTIKIGGGKDTSSRGTKESSKRDNEKRDNEKRDIGKKEEEAVPAKCSTDVKPERKRERRRHSRRRRGKEDRDGVDADSGEEAVKDTPVTIQSPSSEDEVDQEERSRRMAAMLPPPSELISETLIRYREDELFKGVFEETADEPLAAEICTKEGYVDTEDSVAAEGSIEEVHANADAEVKQATADADAERAHKDVETEEVKVPRSRTKKPRAKEVEIEHDAIEAKDQTRDVSYAPDTSLEPDASTTSSPSTSVVSEENVEKFPPISSPSIGTETEQ